MSREAVGKLIDRWLNEPEFRSQLRKDPEGTVRTNGVQLSPEEWASLKKVDWKLSDEELKSHMSKGM